MHRSVLVRALLALAVLVPSIWSALTLTPTLGLDLRGGTQIALETRDAPGIVADAASTNRVLGVLRDRVDGLGVAEPSLSRSGERRIVVELPGLEDPAEAADVLGRTAQLTIHPVLGPATGVDAARVLPDEDGTPLALGPPALAGEDVSGARASSATPGVIGSVVDVTFAGDGRERWRALTAQAACAAPGDPARRIAIVLDDSVISSPQVDPSIACGAGMPGGSTQITGSFGREQAGDLAVLISGGALPVPVEIIEQRTVGPTLGAAAIEASAVAAAIGVALTGVFLLTAYRLVGLAAVAALVGYVVISYAGLTALGATLTLPGLAGFVLAIGMAVDANVLVAERAREEYQRVRRLDRAAEIGYRSALPAVADSAVTTLLAAGLLFGLASGPVRGFGVTLTLGVLVSLYSALVLSRMLTIWLVRRPSIRRRPAWSGLASPGPVRTWLGRCDPDLLRRHRRWLACSAVVVLLALAGVAVRGLNFGVEFTGGRAVEFSTAQLLDPEVAREAVADAGFPGVAVQSTGTGGLSVRSGNLTDEDVTALRDVLADAAGGADLLRDERIGPSLGEELRRGALVALGVALAAQLIYLAVRFRWVFSAGAVVALIANVSVVVGVFAWWGRPVDGVFLAALLTVIGYTVNDSVVVFDRVREGWTTQHGPALRRLVGSAVLATLPRTVNTGVSTLVILVALLLLGGDTLVDFALALLVGIVVGTASTISVAAPLAIELQGRRRPPAPRRAPARRRSTGAVV
ncbi:protein translocase subunit SecD [Pseudonocardia xinjiangensis]|uniref:Multifunctional fusion protein n=1 Tax=Pseudonocardia xinjiangensis TaxID=75289 RepID=A0ABX1R686_9PSEU|nr:protein translocase subunit SecD [Pseudonocardia xinjiangensis]NMH75577.1 protein translocase subunit SecD [Pseudonocardia xinjiangensis]